MKFLKKNQKSILIITIIFIFSSFLLLLKSYFYTHEITRGDTVLNIKPVVESELKIKNRTSSPLPSTATKKLERVELNVLGKNYNGEIVEGETVYQFMKNLQDDKESNFSFSGEDHPGLGFFIKEIDGVKGKAGSYWIYYVNGEEASVGVSNYILKDGDIVSWKQEAF